MFVGRKLLLKLLGLIFEVLGVKFPTDIIEGFLESLLAV